MALPGLFYPANKPLIFHVRADARPEVVPANASAPAKLQATNSHTAEAQPAILPYRALPRLRASDLCRTAGQFMHACLGSRRIAVMNPDTAQTGFSAAAAINPQPVRCCVMVCYHYHLYKAFQ